MEEEGFWAGVWRAVAGDENESESWEGSQGSLEEPPRFPIFDVLAATLVIQRAWRRRSARVAARAKPSRRDQLRARRRGKGAASRRGSQTAEADIADAGAGAGESIKVHEHAREIIVVEPAAHVPPSPHPAVVSPPLEAPVAISAQEDEPIGSCEVLNQEAESGGSAISVVEHSQSVQPSSATGGAARCEEPGGVSFLVSDDAGSLARPAESEVERAPASQSPRLAVPVLPEPACRVSSPGPSPRHSPREVAREKEPNCRVAAVCVASTQTTEEKCALSLGDSEKQKTSDSLGHDHLLDTGGGVVSAAVVVDDFDESSLALKNLVGSMGSLRVQCRDQPPRPVAVAPRVLRTAAVAEFPARGVAELQAIADTVSLAVAQTQKVRVHWHSGRLRTAFAER
mmetsp:Transcript_31800/g.82362  ORF Transcript_31800/g.82362 Transcript_31800/m.82362 type:complete len:399 (+) Transcript_31800:23-1219(+)